MAPTIARSIAERSSDLVFTEQIGIVWEASRQWLPRTSATRWVERADGDEVEIAHPKMPRKTLGRLDMEPLAR